MKATLASLVAASLVWLCSFSMLNATAEKVGLKMYIVEIAEFSFGASPYGALTLIILPELVSATIGTAAFLFALSVYVHAQCFGMRFSLPGLFCRIFLISVLLALSLSQPDKISPWRVLSFMGVMFGVIGIAVWSILRVSSDATVRC